MLFAVHPTSFQSSSSLRLKPLPAESHMLEENLSSVGANTRLRGDPFHTDFKRTFQKTAGDANRGDHDSWRHVCIAESASVDKGLTKTLICDLSRTLKNVSIFTELSMRHKSCPNLNRDLEISVARLCPILCKPMDCNPPGASVHGVLQARRLEWVAMPSSRGSSRPRDGTHISCTGRWILYRLSPTGSPKEEVALGIQHTLHPVFLVASRAHSWADQGTVPELQRRAGIPTFEWRDGKNHFRQTHQL